MLPQVIHIFSYKLFRLIYQHILYNDYSRLYDILSTNCYRLTYICWYAIILLAWEEFSESLRVKVLREEKHLLSMSKKC